MIFGPVSEKFSDFPGAHASLDSRNSSLLLLNQLHGGLEQFAFEDLKLGGYGSLPTRVLKLEKFEEIYLFNYSLKFTMYYVVIVKIFANRYFFFL